MSKNYEPVNVDDVSLLGQVERDAFGFFHIVTLNNDGSPEISACFNFCDRRYRRHYHGYRNVEPFTVITHRLRVVSQRRGYHAVLFVFVWQHHQRVKGTTFFKAAKKTNKKYKIILSWQYIELNDTNVTNNVNVLLYFSNVYTGQDNRRRIENLQMVHIYDEYQGKNILISNWIHNISENFYAPRSIY